MKIENIKIKKFRSYDHLELSFSPEVNILYGKNGTGKTNLVESLYFLALTKSFRLNNDKFLIKKNEIAATVEGNILTDVSTNYKITINEEGKRIEIDKTKVKKMSEYISRINVILFNPLDSKVINDAPAVRRRLLNVEISQLYKEYLVYLSNYDKVLKQRNTYLKVVYTNGNASKDYLNILTDKLIEYGIKIAEYRNNFINSINEYITDIYKNIFLKGELRLRYSSDFKNKSADEIREKFRELYIKEISNGKTVIGIQHDDIDFLLDGNKLKDWGSVGQIKNSIISFKLAEIIVFEKIKHEFPILILDDLFSELDKEKIENILKMLNHNVQTFITTTDIDNVNTSLFNDYKIFNVTEDGIKEA